jgi:hypothetical protein
MTASSQLDLKQRLARLSEKDRLAISAYLLRLKHQSKSGRRALSKTMSEMDAGKKTKLSDLSTRHCDLTGVVYDGLNPQVKEQLFAERRQPRAKDKPVIRS